MLSTIKWKLSKNEIIVIAVLTVLTALEPLSIDTYLSSFTDISESLSVPIYKIQISLSVFLGGFAVGQLFWGTLSDKIGRRKPILISLILFAGASILCMTAENIEVFWVGRFFQAFFGCAPVVISRAIITDVFPSKKILYAFSILAMTQSVAPLIGPALGNFIRETFSWRYIFFATGVMGILSVLCAMRFLKETNFDKSPSDNILKSYVVVCRSREFLSATLSGSVVYAALMMYISNSSIIFMREFDTNGIVFTSIFLANSLAIFCGSFYISKKSGQNKSEQYLKLSFVVLAFLSSFLFVSAFFYRNIWATALILFFLMFVLGILFPITTNLSLKPFVESNKSGTASSIFGFGQLAFAFVFTVVMNSLIEDPIVLLSSAFILCSGLGIAPYISMKMR